ncbi:MAG: hypothetical protein AB1480_13580 [Nitrospirota bacterium]
MKKSIFYFTVVSFVISALFAGYIYSAEQTEQIPKTEQADVEKKEKSSAPVISNEDLYKKAIDLKDNGKYDAAIEILKKLVAENPNNSSFEISYVDAVLDKIQYLKETQNPDWQANIKEVATRLKSLYPKNKQNADYYIIHAKYAWIIEARRESHISKALEKALYFKPGYAEAYILQGDVYLDKAIKGGDEESDQSASLSHAPQPAGSSLAYQAKTAYEKALSGANLNDKRKAYVFYKLGNLENQIFGKKDAAKANWEKAVSLAPDSKAGQSAKQQLSK